MNVEVSDKKAMGIYRGLAERLLLQTGASESQTEKEEAEKPPANIVERYGRTAVIILLHTINASAVIKQISMT